MEENNHALIIGASGLIGWPLDLGKCFWPKATPPAPKLNLVTGVDLLCTDEEFEETLKDRAEHAASLTHVYYFAFKESSDPIQEVEINVNMMRRVARAVKHLSLNFRFLVYPGGTRGYGIYRPGGIFSAPLHEEMADELPSDYLETVAYPHYRAMLSSESSGSGWSWCEIVPDAIIGFTPNGSGFSLAGHWATFLSTYRLVHGEGAEVHFPGVLSGYNSLFTETSASTLAKVAIFASLHPDEFNERIFNVADSARPSSMRELWPEITKHFKLTGVPPLPTSSASDEKPSDFIKKHKHIHEAAGATGIDIWNATQLDSYGYWLTFDRHLSLKRLRQAGYNEDRPPIDGWKEAFEQFQRAGMIV